MRTELIFLLFSLMLPSGFINAEIREDSHNSVTILHDPFQKPDFILSPIKQKVVALPKSNKLPWNPQLIMTLRAGRDSMANVAGKVIGLGEKIDGYQLIEVYERSVVFVNKGKITRLTLDKE